MIKLFLEGFFLQASLILALGAQNIFVLESGLKKERHFLVASLCTLCDLILITIGVMGAASIFLKYPFLKVSFGLLGVFFLVYYGLKKLIEAFKLKGLDQSHHRKILSAKEVILLSLGFSLLNPHVYLDTVILIGGYSAKFSETIERIQFGVGAGVFSMIWFFALAYFASSMSAILNNPKSMKVISFVSGAILIILSWKLGLDVYSWINL